MPKTMAHREKGIYAFKTVPSEYLLMPTRFRSLMGQGRITEAMQPVNEALWLCGYGCYAPDYHIRHQDLSPRPVASHQPRWLQEYVEAFNYRAIRLGERVAEHYGYSYIKQHYCPVCWGRPQCVSEKELAEKIGLIAAQAGSVLAPSIQLDNYAVTDESYRLYHMSMPVVWMRYSYLRSFKAGQDLINVYRMMKNSDRVYDIPRFPYEGVPDYLI